MLRPPYTRYKRLFIYHLDTINIPAIDDPDFIGLWHEDGNGILFFHKNKDAVIAALCEKNDCSLVYQADLDYEEWDAGQTITPFTVGSLTVAPVWNAENADIILDPSVVFGSGFHPTTRSCLQMVNKYTTTPELHIGNMLDLGTGTGLLAIAAAKQGTRAKAYDNNPLACEIAKANTVRNRVADLVTVREMDLRTNIIQTRNIDLVVANIHPELLQDLFSAPEFWQGNLYILSGFMQSMEPELLTYLDAKSIKFLERTRNGKWCVWVLAPETSAFFRS
jgi:ribosomal protein L11 methyltransferase